MIIKIKNLRAITAIGIYDWEKTRRQISLDIEVEYDGSAAAKSDDMNDGVDYDKISYIILEEIEKSKFSLIEKLVDHLCEKILEIPKISRVKIEIHKPGAVRIADSVSITHEKKR
jgi:FolB domain-containing protein